MKKSVLLIIGVIYVAAILIIGFFGMEQVVYKEINHVTGIEIVNEGVRNVPGMGWVIYLQAGETNTIIEYKLITENGDDATYDGVDFIYDTETTQGIVEITPLGAVIFQKPNNAVCVTVKSEDTFGVEVDVWIFCYE